MIILQIDGDQLDTIVQAAVRKALTTETTQNKPQPEVDELLTVSGAAKFLSLSVPTIYGLISKGALPVMKRSKRCYFSKNELLQYLKAGKRKSNSEIDVAAIEFTNGRAL